MCCDNDILKGYVRKDSQGNILWDTFSLDEELSLSPGWEYIEIPCEPITTSTSTTTSSTTIPFTTPPPTTTSTSTTSTSSTSTTSTSTTSTTSTSTSTSSTTSTSTSTTTSTTSTSSTTTSTSTTSSTTTTTTTLPAIDATFATYFGGNALMSGTKMSNADVNAQSFIFFPQLGDGDTKGEVVNGATSYLITIFINFTGSASPVFAQNNCKIQIKNSVIGGTVIETSPVGITSPGQIQFTSTMLGSSYPVILLTF